VAGTVGFEPGPSQPVNPGEASLKFGLWMHGAERTFWALDRDAWMARNPTPLQRLFVALGDDRCRLIGRRGHLGKLA
jgi:hypothetical protein